MISKESFVTALNAIKNKSDALDDVLKGLMGLRLDISEYMMQQDIIDLIHSNMNIKCVEGIGSTLEWWIYETNFGRDFEPEITLTEDGTEKVITLDTPEKLYDYLVEYEIDKVQQK